MDWLTFGNGFKFGLGFVCAYYLVKLVLYIGVMVLGLGASLMMM